MLVKEVLKTGLANLFTELSQNENGDEAREKLVNGLTDIIDKYIKTATVSVTVNTVGTAAAQSGFGTGNLS